MRNILEKPIWERAAAEVTPSTLSATLHGNAFFSKKRAPRCMGALSRKSRRVRPRVDGEPVAKRKTNATLHESFFFSKKRAPRCMGTLARSTVNRQPGPTGPSHGAKTSATLHGNAFRIFMVQLDAPEQVPPKCPNHYF